MYAIDSRDSVLELRGVPQSSRALDDLASMLRVAPAALRRLVEDCKARLDTVFVIDVVAALVGEFAVDPQWLLTGQYDSTIHRRALMLGEDRTDDGKRALRDFVREQYQRLRDGSTLASFPLAKPPE